MTVKKMHSMRVKIHSMMVRNTRHDGKIHVMTVKIGHIQSRSTDGSRAKLRKNIINLIKIKCVNSWW